MGSCVYWVMHTIWVSPEGNGSLHLKFIDHWHEIVEYDDILTHYLD